MSYARRSRGFGYGSKPRPMSRARKLNFALRMPFPCKEEWGYLSFQVTGEDEFWINASPPHCSVVSIYEDSERLPELIQKFRELAQKYGQQQIQLDQRIKLGLNRDIDGITLKFVDPNFEKEIRSIHEEFDIEHKKKKIEYNPHMTVRRPGYSNEAVWRYYKPGMLLNVSDMFYREVAGESSPKEFFVFQL